MHNAHDPAREIERAKSALWYRPPPKTRDEWWPLLGSALAEGISDSECLSWCASDPDATESDLRDAKATIRSLRNRPQSGTGSLFAIRRAQGWRDDTATHQQRAQEPQKDQHQQKTSNRAAFDVDGAWQAGKPATGDEAYITKKAGSPDRLRVYRGPLRIAGEALDGALMIPLGDPAGKLLTVQFILASGRKLNAPGRPVHGYHVVGDLAEADRVFVVEGIGQAWTAHQVTGKPAAVAFGAGRLAEVAKQLRDRFAGEAITLVADRGKESQCARIAADLGCAWCELPASMPENADLNDLHLADPDGTAAAAVLASVKHPPRLWNPPECIGGDEWSNARSTPDCIVDDYLFADVGVFIAPGGTGKTTLILAEAIHIALGRELFGLTIRKPGPVVILTAEDSREMLIARLRSIAGDMELTERELRAVRERVLISDVSGAAFKLTEVLGDVVRPAATVDALIDGCGRIKPVLIVIDPAVSFGVGESRVNDAEQGLVEAARKLRNALNCCVRYVHHSGKANAREKTLDQYSGRGGSAFADGARMVAVLQSLTPGEWQKATGTELGPGQQGLVLARPKLSYAPPAGPIYVTRQGYHFAAVEPAEHCAEAELESQANKLLDFLFAEMAKGTLHTQNSLQAICRGFARAEIRDAVAYLIATGRLEHRQREGAGKGGARTYLHPFATPTKAGAPKPETPSSCASEETAIAAPPPLGKTTAAHQCAQYVSPSPDGAPDDNGAATAHLAQQSGSSEKSAPSWYGSNGWGAI